MFCALRTPASAEQLPIFRVSLHISAWLSWRSFPHGNIGVLSSFGVYTVSSLKSIRIRRRLVFWDNGAQWYAQSVLVPGSIARLCLRRAPCSSREKVLGKTRRAYRRRKTFPAKQSGEVPPHARLQPHRGNLLRPKQGAALRAVQGEAPGLAGPSAAAPPAAEHTVRGRERLQHNKSTGLKHDIYVFYCQSYDAVFFLLVQL